MSTTCSPLLQHIYIIKVHNRNYYLYVVTLCLKPFLNLRSCLYLCSCGLVKRRQSQPSTVLVNLQPAKYTQNARMCSCSAHFIRDASRRVFWRPGSYSPSPNNRVRSPSLILRKAHSFLKYARFKCLLPSVGKGTLPNFDPKIISETGNWSLILCYFLDKLIDLVQWLASTWVM